MSRSSIVTTILLGLVSASFLFVSCRNEEGGSLYDPSAPLGPTPAVTSISPADSARAGVDTLTIVGSNFSSAPGNNIAYFNADPGVVVQASPTQLVVIPPTLDVLPDTVVMRVAVLGAQLMSEPASYILQAAAGPFGSLSQAELAGGLTTDGGGTLYAAVGEGGSDKGIFAITPSGSKTSYAPATLGVSLWSGLKMGPGGAIYATRNIRAIYQFSSGGGSSAGLWTAFPTGVTILDFDFDQNQYLWAVGNNSVIYCVKQDKSVTTSPFVGNVRSVRVFGTDLYFSATVGGEEKIYKAPIQGDVLGTPVVYFDFEAAFGAQGYVPQGITFASDGTLYIGTNGAVGIVVVDPTLSATTPFSSYSSLFGSSVKTFAWGAGEALYASTSDGALLKILSRGLSAPYYGAQ